MVYRNIHYTEHYGTQIALPDVTAAEAAAGNVTTFQRTLKNTSACGIHQIRLWMDTASAQHIEISADNSIFDAPTKKENAVAFGSCAAGSTFTVYIKRTVAANTSYDPKKRIKLYAAWQGK